MKQHLTVQVTLAGGGNVYRRTIRHAVTDMANKDVMELINEVEQWIFSPPTTDDTEAMLGRTEGDNHGG